MLTLLRTDLPLDDNVYVEAFIEETSGSGDSNMTRIENYAGETDNSIASLKGVGYTDQTIKNNFDLITQVNSRVTYTVNVSGTNTLVGTISQITGAPLSDSILKIYPSAMNTGSVTLNVNSEGTKPVVKIQNWTGSKVEAPLTEGDFTVGQPVIITKSPDGTKYIYIGIENTSDNIYYKNGVNNYETVTSKLNGKIDKSLITATNDLIFGASAGVPVKKTLAEAKTILNINNLVYDNPIVTTITTGFASGWSGVVNITKNHNGLLEFETELNKNVDMSIAETILTLAVGFRPSKTINILLNLRTSSYGSVTNGIAFLEIATTGTVGIVPITGTNLVTARKIAFTQCVYYTA